MWPWSAAALKEQLDRIERNQLRLALALKIDSQWETAPVGVPERVAPRAPRRKLTEADVHFAGRPATRPPIAVPATADPSRPLVSPIEVLTDLEAPIVSIPSPPNPALSSVPLGSSAPQRPLAPAAPPVGQVMHWRDSGSLTSQLP